VEAKPACEPGQFIGRDISRGESVEAEINSFISKRHERCVKMEEERPIEDVWRASERRQEARRREENRLAWQSYFSRLAKSLRARAEEYDQRAQTLAEEQPKGDAI
jgi:hypothetical protein